MIKKVYYYNKEMQDIKWFNKEDLIKRVNNNYEDLTEK